MSIINIYAKILNKTLLKQIQKHFQRIYIMTKWNLSQECKVGLTYKN